MPLTATEVRDLIELYVDNNPLKAFQDFRMRRILIGIQDQIDDAIIGAGGEPTIAAGTIAQYWRGDKTWQILNNTAVGLGNVPNINATNAANLSSGFIPAGRFGNFTIPLSALAAAGTPTNDMALFYDGWRVPVIPTDAVPTAASTNAVQSGGVYDALALKANIASPTFTGVPAAPTAAPGTNTTQLATTAFVTAAVAAATTGVSSFNGRTGAVVSVTNDYTWAQIDKTTSSFADITTRSAGDISSGTLPDARLSGNVVMTTGSYANPSWITALAWVKITGTPTTLTGYGITDGVTLNGVETLTNKTISGSSNKLTNIAQTSVTNLISDLALKANIASPTFTGVPAAPTAAPGTNTTQLATTAFVTAAVSAATTGVSSWAGRTGAVIPLANDYTWAQINKATSSFADITTRSATDISSGTLADARLSGNVVLTTGSYANPAWITSLNFLTKVYPTITGTPDGSKFLKDDGTWATIPGGNPGTVTNVSGTTNRITVTSPTSTPVIDIASTYAGQNTITTLGTIATGVWQGTQVADAYIVSAATWHSKQPGDADLTQIAALTPSNDDFIQRKAGVWTNRTIAQVVADLAVMSNPMTTVGDIIRGGTAGAPTRLGIGTVNQVLASDGTIPGWSTLLDTINLLAPLEAAELTAGIDTLYLRNVPTTPTNGTFYGYSSSDWGMFYALTGFTAVGSSPNANGGSVSGNLIQLQPANLTNPGIWTAGAQTLAGDKTIIGSSFGLNVQGSTGVSITSTVMGLYSSAPLAVYGRSTGLVSPAAYFERIDNTTNAVSEVLALGKASSTGTSLAGIGSKIGFYSSCNGSTAREMSKINVITTDVGFDVEDATFDIHLRNNGTLARKFLIGSNGRLTLDAYTSIGAVTGGTAIGNLQYDASGNIIAGDLAAGGGGMTNPMTTTGDMIYSSSGSTPARLAAGTNGYFLTMVAGIPAWTNVSDTITVDNSGPSGIEILFASGTTIYAKKLIAGTNITLDDNPDDTITINSSGGGGASQWDDEITGISYDNKVKIGSSGVAAEALEIRVDQNAATRFQVKNATAGATAQTAFILRNDGDYSVQALILSSTYSGSGLLNADMASIISNAPNGFSLMCTSEALRFAANGTTEGFRLATVSGISYLNFGGSSGSGDYGIRNNAGTIEIKHSGGSWGVPGGASLTLNQVLTNGNSTGGLSVIYSGTGTGRDVKFSNPDLVDNFAILDIVPNNGTNAGTHIRFGPRGTGFSSTRKAEVILYNTDFVADGANTEYLLMGSTGSGGYVFNSDISGTGTLRDISFQIDAVTALKIDTGLGITLSDLAGNGAGFVAVDNNGLLSWSAGAGGGMSNPMTTTSDMIYSSSGSTPARLGIGTEGHVLTVVSGVPAWAAAASGMTNPMTTTGDMIYSSSGSTPARRAIGTTGQVLTVSAGLPEWVTLNGTVRMNSLVSSIAIANTETVVIYTTIPANNLQTGSCIKVRAYCTQAGTNVATPTVRIRIGSTAITGAITATLTGNAGGSAVPSTFEGLVTIRTTGSSGTALGGLSQNKNAIAPGANTLSATVTVNTTIENQAALTFISGNGTNTYTFQVAEIEVIHPTPLS